MIYADFTIEPFTISLREVSEEEMLPKSHSISTVQSYLDHYLEKSETALKFHRATDSNKVFMKHPQIDPLGRTALHLASHSDDFYISADKLIKSFGLDPNVKDINGFTPLHVAAIRNSIKIAELLIANNAIIDICDLNELRTPLHLAAISNSITIIQLLLRKKKDIANRFDKFKWSPLHIAVANNSFASTKLILEKGCPNDVNALNQHGMSPLHIAAANNSTEIASLLLTKGHSDVNVLSQRGISPLHIAVNNNSIEMVMLLLNHKANPNVRKLSKRKSHIRQNCVLHSAVANNSLEMVKLLLSAGADPTLTNAREETALHVAPFINTSDEETRLKIVDLLLSHPKTNPNAADFVGRTVLFAATFNNTVDIVKRLLDKPNIEVSLGEKTMGISPLHLAAYLKLDQISEMLIANNAEIDAQDHNGETPLVYAASSNAYHVAKQLLEKKAKTNLKNKERKSRIPLHVAAAYGSEEVGLLLILADKSSVEATDDLGFTPLHYAGHFSQAKFEKRLLEIQAKQMKCPIEELPIPQKTKKLSLEDVKWVRQLGNTLINIEFLGLNPHISVLKQKLTEVYRRIQDEISRGAKRPEAATFSIVGG